MAVVVLAVVLQEGVVPEGGQQRGVDGVSIVDVNVVPAALRSEVVEPQSEDGVGPATQTHFNIEADGNESMD